MTDAGVTSRLTSDVALIASLIASLSNASVLALVCLSCKDISGQWHWQKSLVSSRVTRTLQPTLSSPQYLLDILSLKESAPGVSPLSLLSVDT